MNLLMMTETNLERVIPVYEDGKLVDIQFIVREYRFNGFFRDTVRFSDCMPVDGLTLNDIESLIHYFKEIKEPVDVQGLFD